MGFETAPVTAMLTHLSQHGDRRKEGGGREEGHLGGARFVGEAAADMLAPVVLCG